MTLWESLSDRSVVMNKKSYFLLITILVCSLLSPLILKFYCFAQENLNREIKSYYKKSTTMYNVYLRN
jgi:hypothetical protein